MNISQIMAVVIFIVMFTLIITEVIERYQATLLAAIATIVIVFLLCMHSTRTAWEVVSVSDLVHGEFWYTAAGNEAAQNGGINWATIIFLAGMMVMVEAMGRSGFFRYICLALAKLVSYRPTRLFVIFMCMSAALAMFIDSITVILFLASVTVELAALLKMDPIPLIIAEIFCANLGGAATMCGDPPNIIIGTELGYSFADFLLNTGTIALAALVLTIIFFYFSLRRQLIAQNKVLHETGHIDYPEPKSAITDMVSFRRSCVIFAIAVILLVTHSMTGLTVATIGVLIAAVTIVFAGGQAFSILRALDYKTLLFFTGLFVVVGGLEETGVLAVIAGGIAAVSGGNIYITVAVILWVSAVCSAFVDNIPFAATMVPVIESLSATLGIPLSTLAWSLSIGTDIGGSATPIGASANVVGISIAAKNGHLISWKKYCRYAVPATVIAITTAMVMIFVIHC